MHRSRPGLRDFTLPDVGFFRTPGRDRIRVAVRYGGAPLPEKPDRVPDRPYLRRLRWSLAFLLFLGGVAAMVALRSSPAWPGEGLILMVLAFLLI